MLRKVLAGFGVLAALFVIVVAVQPSEFGVERRIDIKVAPATVFPLIDNLRLWAKWSPWENRDPAMHREYSGSESGTGAVYAWRGNPEVGAGRMTIVESLAPERIVLRLDFLEPFAATNQAVFALTPNGSGTTVSWQMTGKNNFMAKAIGLFLDFDTMVGNDFETGLASLKSAAENTAP